MAAQHRQLAMFQHRLKSSRLRLGHVGPIGRGHVFGQRFQRP
jgi:hypothetical protein